ncbi:MAG: hypothetical protein QOI82_1141 [Actinomycetota bacterium]|nr:hypothetical protein [Actinomycetota bacterium]
MATTTRTSQAVRWTLLLAALGVVWLTSAHPVPLYDGIGFPDEPYRFVPPRGAGPAATTAQVDLKVAGGSNTGGLIVNTSEAGPQASLFAPPHAFAAAGSTPIRLVLRPVPPQQPMPSGVLESNVYEVALTSAAGPVTIVPEAQPPAITMRSVDTKSPEPVFNYRATPNDPWREIKTRRVGRDIYNAAGPGAGEYVLIRDAAAPAQGSSGGRGALYAVLGATVLLVAGVIVAVRVLSRRAAQQ